MPFQQSANGKTIQFIYKHFKYKTKTHGFPFPKKKIPIFIILDSKPKIPMDFSL